MALDTSSMLLKLNPLHAIDTGGRLANMGMERQRLALERERFEHAKRAAEEQTRYEREAAQAKITREALAAKQARDDAAAAAQAATEAKALDDRQALGLKFAETAAAGNPEGAEAYIPLMQNLGMGVDITRNPGQMPVYRMHENAAADAAKEQAEYGRNWESAERPIYQDAYGEAPVEPEAPMIAPATPTGNVLDLASMQATREARLGPAMAELDKAYPTPEMQDSSARTSRGVLMSGLPADKVLSEYRQQRGGPDDVYKAMLAQDAQSERKDELTEVQKATLRNSGTRFARSTFGDQKIASSLNTMELSGKIRAALESEDPYTQAQAGQLLLQLGEVKGTASDKDLGLAIGDERASYWDQAKNWLETKASSGGFPTAQREALIKWADKQAGTSEQRVYNWLDAMDRDLETRESPYERDGILSYRNSISRPVLDRYEARKAERAKGQGKGAKTAAGGGEDSRAALQDEVMIQAADAGLDSEAILAMFGGESGGGKGDAANKRSSAKGILQFTDETARAMGFKNAAEYAALPATEQVAPTIKYFKSKGLDENSPPEDYAIATAAPAFIGEDEDTVVYRVGSEEHSINEPWHPKDGGDITVGSILAYYRKGGLGKAPKAAEAPKPESLGVQKVGSVPARNPKDKAALDFLETL